MKHILGKQRRAKRIRSKVQGTDLKPRLSVYRSGASIYAQVIDDEKAVTIIGVAEKHLDTHNGTKTERAKRLGSHLAKMALEKKVKAVIFDKGGYKYHGRVKAFAEGAREGGLNF